MSNIKQLRARLLELARLTNKDNFDEVEPILKSLYLEKEMKKSKNDDKER